MEEIKYNMTSLTKDTRYSKYTNINQIICGLRQSNIPAKERRLVRRATKSKYCTYDYIPTTDMYYVSFINNVLRNIRHGEVDYIFKIKQLKELLRYEPDLEVSYADDIFTVWLPSTKSSDDKSSNGGVFDKQ